MGYTSELFEEIGKLHFPQKNILDVGAQDVRVSSTQEVDQLNQFIKIHNPDGALLKIKKFPHIMEAKEVYVKAGFSYTSIDVDERPSTLRVDLAKFQIPRPRGQFDLVVNVGTTEHLSSPIAAFALMHEMCCKGGTLFNDVPLFGFGNHGFVNLTPKFWHALIWMNSYGVQNVRVRKINESMYDRGNFFHTYLNYMEGLENVENNSCLLTAILKKQSDKIFIIPYDAIIPDSDLGQSLAALLYGSFYPFLQTGAYSTAEVIEAINDFLRYNDKKFRVLSLKEFEAPNTLIKKKGTSFLGIAWLKRLLSDDRVRSRSS